MGLKICMDKKKNRLWRVSRTHQQNRPDQEKGQGPSPYDLNWHRKHLCGMD